MYSFPINIYISLQTFSNFLFFIHNCLLGPAFLCEFLNVQSESFLECVNGTAAEEE